MENSEPLFWYNIDRCNEMFKRRAKTPRRKNILILFGLLFLWNILFSIFLLIRSILLTHLGTVLAYKIRKNTKLQKSENPK